MSNSFDLPPIYDALTKSSHDLMSDSWLLWMTSFIDNLSSYITQFGITPPNLTTAQRDTIQSPKNGQMIYNTTLGSAQYFKAGAWTSF